MQGVAKEVSTPEYTPEGFPYYNQWKHVAVTWDTNKLIFYIDGQEIDRESTTDYYGRKIGIYTIGKNFNGTLDEVMFYNRGLSESEIQAIYCGQGGNDDFC